MPDKIYALSYVDQNNDTTIMAVSADINLLKQSANDFVEYPAVSEGEEDTDEALEWYKLDGGIRADDGQGTYIIKPTDLLV